MTLKPCCAVVPCVLKDTPFCSPSLALFCANKRSMWALFSWTFLCSVNNSSTNQQCACLQTDWFIGIFWHKAYVTVPFCSTSRLSIKLVSQTSVITFLSFQHNFHTCFCLLFPMIAGKSLLKMSCKKNTCDKEAKRTLETFFSGNHLFHFMSIESAKVLFFRFSFIIWEVGEFFIYEPCIHINKREISFYSLAWSHSFFRTENKSVRSKNVCKKNCMLSWC